jgi:N-acetylglucosaminyl-diphospho-decaprenol L-rhamnosyltransferase
MANVIHDARNEPAAPPAPQDADLSIVIVSWNSERWIDRCLQSIPGACGALEFEIILHDNDSHDATIEIAERSREVLPRFRILRSAVNSGFAAGTNRALAEASGRYVFLLNPDCELLPGALARLHAFLEEHPRTAAAAPLLIDESGDSQREFQLRRLPTVWTFFSELLLAGRLFPKNAATASYRYRDLDLTEPRRIEQPAAAALLLRRAMMDAVGPLDEQFSPAWFEDVDYCRRLAERGLEVWVVPAAKARHYGGASLDHMRFAGFADIWYRNLWRYAQKWMPGWRAEAVRGAIIAGMVLRCMAAVVGVTPTGVGRGEAFRAYRDVLKKAFDRWSPV